MVDSRVKLIIDAMDNASGPLEQVRKTTNQLEKAMFDAAAAAKRLADAEKALAANTDPAKQDKFAGEVAKARVELDKADDSVRKYATELKRLDDVTVNSRSGAASLSDTWRTVSGGILAATVAVTGFILASKKVFETWRQVNELEFARDKFDRLSESIGTTSDMLLYDLKNATSGLVSDAKLVESAGQMMALGLAKTHDEVVRLTNVAGKLGMDMNQLVLTLTNQTTMRFDALNVSVDGFDERLQKLKDSGMAANEAFTEAFLQQAEEQIKKVGDRAESTAGQIDKLTAAWDNFTETAKIAALGGEANFEMLINLINAMTALQQAVNAGKMSVWQAQLAFIAMAGGGYDAADALWLANRMMTGLTRPEYAASLRYQAAALWAEAEAAAAAAAATQRLLAAQLALANDTWGGSEAMVQEFGSIIVPGFSGGASVNTGGGGGGVSMPDLPDLADDVKTLAEGLQDLASAYDSLGDAAQSLYQKQAIDPLEEQLKALGDPDKLLERKEEILRILKQMEDERLYYGSSYDSKVGELQDELGGINDTLEEQRRISEELAAVKEKMLELDKAQQEIDFLQQQFKFLEMLKEYGLNPADILGGVNLGVNADLAGLIEAMTRALREIGSTYNLNITSNAPTENLAQDFALLEAMNTP